MRRITLLLSLIILTSGVLISQETEIKINDNIKLIKLNESFYVHESLFNFDGAGTFASNGLIFIKNGKAILIDTPNDNIQTKQLVDYLAKNMNIEIEKVIVGHSHSDCMGGLEYLKSLKIESISNFLTKEICQEKQLPIPIKTFAKKLEFNFHGAQIICQYFGGGHTLDNIVVYFPEQEVLFGGCLIRSLTTRNLGNIAEADLENWDKTVEKVKVAYPNSKFVIPGHGKYGNADLLTHTIQLIKSYKNN